jgi:hypothetical protein
VLRFAAAFALVAVAWASLSVGAETAYSVKILEVGPWVDQRFNQLFNTCRYETAVGGNGSTRKVWVLLVRDGKGIWDSKDIGPEGASWKTQTGVAGKILPGQHKVEVLLFEESTPLPKTNEDAGTVPAEWLPRATDSIAFGVGPVAFPARTDVIWVSSVPLGCAVYAAKREDVVDPAGNVDLDRLDDHFVGYAPVMVSATPGRYAVAVEVGVEEGFGFLGDQSQASYSVRTGEPKTLRRYGRVFDVTKRSGELAVLIAVFAPTGWSYTKLRDLYPGGDNFVPTRQALQNILDRARQRGWAVPIADLDPMLDLLCLGGKVIWVGPWVEKEQKTLVITKVPDGYSWALLTIRR